jgi:hypothetical protein
MASDFTVAWQVLSKRTIVFFFTVRIKLHSTYEHLYMFVFWMA